MLDAATLAMLDAERARHEREQAFFAALRLASESTGDERAAFLVEARKAHPDLAAEWSLQFKRLEG